MSKSWIADACFFATFGEGVVLFKGLFLAPSLPEVVAVVAVFKVPVHADPRSGTVRCQEVCTRIEASATKRRFMEF